MTSSNLRPYFFLAEGAVLRYRVHCIYIHTTSFYVSSHLQPTAVWERHITSSHNLVWATDMDLADTANTVVAGDNDHRPSNIMAETRIPYVTQYVRQM